MTSPDIQLLKTKLAITSKTASLLLQLGYKDYRNLRAVSPINVVTQLAKLPNVSAKEAQMYRRGLRRMVWLATHYEPETQAKIFPHWTQKAIVARGWWVSNNDDLTGDQAARHIDAVEKTR